MSKFIEKRGEKEGPRRRRFLKFLRELPMPDATWDEKRKIWLPRKREGEQK